MHEPEAAIQGGDETHHRSCDRVATRRETKIIEFRVKAGKAGHASGHAMRALLLAEPASVDGGEITDKGQINQRAVLTRRPGAVTAPGDNASIAWIGCGRGARISAADSIVAKATSSWQSGECGTVRSQKQSSCRVFHGRFQCLSAEAAGAMPRRRPV